MSDLPKLPGGWEWGLKNTDRYASAHSHDHSEMIDAIKSDTQTAIARVAAMVEAVVGSEVKRG